MKKLKIIQINKNTCWIIGNLRISNVNKLSKNYRNIILNTLKVSNDFFKK